MKKLTLITTLAAFALGMNAQAMNSESGIYAGLHLGTTSWDFKGTSTSSGTTSARKTTDDQSFDIGVHIGYMHNFEDDFFIPDFMLAVEPYFTYSTAEGSSTDSSMLRQKYEAPYSFGINVKPGIVLEDDWLIYGLIGFRYTSFEGKLSSSGTKIVDKDEGGAGVTFGGGIEKEVYLFDYYHRFGLEVDYTVYEHVKFTQAGSNLNMKPSALEVSFRYSFLF